MAYHIRNIRMFGIELIIWLWILNEIELIESEMGTGRQGERYEAILGKFNQIDANGILF